VSVIKPGDLVRHKSGGPFMTVAKSERNNGAVRCVWYDSGRPGSEFFPTSDLVPVSQPPPTPEARQGAVG